MKGLKIFCTVLLIIFQGGICAQEYSMYPTKQRDRGVEMANRGFRKLCNRIAFNEDFEYRKELRTSKSNNTIFHFRDTVISKTQVLRHFKKAARKSDNIEEFQQYFLKRKLHYIKVLDRKTLAEIHHTIRLTTLKGYFDILEMFCPI